ncbi:lysine--tRNA ligase [Candidatus Woesearchaeota archaeon]|jgi:lysyl-tRNA synthetase, class II|nr:lysine--tRNA ligase [Candidatus Woesearchaeota archaeon]MBT6518650.1 lysine--tRNA ligase [Candidatus Woesearchaeota archaeon]MBT7368704.1 lysine--tRNA ligase [Candidatus Woesearchaeota archaeon]
MSEEKSNELSENKLIQERLRKLNELKEAGVNPYPYSFDKTHNAKDTNEKYAGLEKEDKTEDSVKVAGRIMQLRNMGKACFMHIQDESGKIQLYLRKDDLGADTYKLLKKLDIGDIVGCEGKIFKTRMGEVTVYADKFQILCKGIRPLPEKYHGLKDVELRYRQRYLDLIMNQDVKEVFKKRSLMIRYIRDYFHDLDFNEVETPALQIVYGGANARPFETHINAWDMKMFLSISPELYLKRLIVGGFDKVFTICKNFRNEGVDKTHNPEFTMLEFYHSYIDRDRVIEIFEGCVEYVCKKLFGSTKIKRNDIELDFKAPWARLTMVEALKKFADLDVNNMELEQLKELMSQHKIDYDGKLTWGVAVEMLFEELCEDSLVQPTHILDHPRESTPLCKVNRNDDRFVERVESYCLGAELCNGYSELNDPVEQRKLLEAQAEDLRAGADEAHPMDEDFVQAIEYGMPPTGGLGFGVDRMAIMLLGVDTIRDVILFPTMKPVKEEENKDNKDNKE